jgi:hypothetical protein
MYAIYKLCGLLNYDINAYTFRKMTTINEYKRGIIREQND